MMKRIAMVSLALAACSTAVKPEPVRPVASAAPKTTAIPTPVADASAPIANQATIPELTPERFMVDGKPFERVFGIEGATILTRENAVGYLDGERVEWIAKIPKIVALFGPTYIDEVRGIYLDKIDVYYSSTGRGSTPMYLPLTGKGKNIVAASGGGDGVLLPARIGDTLLMSVWSNFADIHFESARGPELTRTFTSDAACGPDEINRPGMTGDPVIGRQWAIGALIEPWSLEATDDGTLVSVGGRCRNRNNEWAEIWEPGKSISRIVDLKPFGHDLSRMTKVGNELWGVRGYSADTFIFRNGNFSVGPRVPSLSQIVRLIVSPSHELLAQTSDQTIHRLVDDAWQPIARLKLADDMSLWSLSVDKNGSYWGYLSPKKGPGGTQVYKFRETGRAPAALECPAWVVSLRIDARNQPKDWQYPATKKALAAYPDAANLKLVEYGPLYSKEVAIPVKSQAEGDAVAPFVKDFSPHVICFTPPNIGRTIDLKSP